MNRRRSERTPRRLRAAAGLLRRLAPRVEAVEAELDALPRLVSRGEVCLDVGAKHGAYSLVMAEAAGPTGRVVAFEPLPGPRRVIRVGRRLLGGRTITLVPSAVAAARGRGTIGLPARRGIPVPGRAFLTSHADGLGSNVGWRHRDVDVPLIDLDGWWADEGRPTISIIKVDVEGAEQQVLDGANELITRGRPTLLLELEDRHLGRFHTSSRTIFLGLIERDYRAAVLSSGRWQEVTEPSDTFRNHLFVHRDRPHARAIGLA